MPFAHRRRHRLRRRPFYRKKAFWLVLAGLLLVAAAAAAAYLLLAPRWLGRIVVNNDLSSGAALEEGYQVSVEIPWKEGLKRDFSNLRIHGPDGTQLRFFVAPESLAYQASPAFARVWIRLPALAASVVKLTYDGGSDTNLSNGAGVFESFEDFSGTVVDQGRWMRTAAVGEVRTQERISTDLLRTKSFIRGQSLAVTPHGILLSRERDPGPSEMVMVSKETGETLYGPADGPVHAQFLSYVPERDYILASSGAREGSAWVYRARDLSFVGTIRFEPAGTDRAALVTYMRENTLLRISTPTSVQEYPIDWDRLTVTPGRSYVLRSGDLLERRTQGFTYRASDNSVYVLEDNKAATSNALHRFTLGDGTLAETGTWLNLPMDPLGSFGEPQGINADPQDGTIHYGGVESYMRPEGARGPRQPSYNIYRLGFSASGGAVIRNPSSRGATAATVRLVQRQPLTGPTRVIIGLGGAVSASREAVGSVIFGIGDALQARLTMDVSYRTSPDLLTGEAFLNRQVQGKLPRSNVVSLQDAIDSLTRPATYEVQWNGLRSRFVVNGVVVGDYTDAVPEVSSASLLRPFILAEPSPSGASMHVFYVARARMAPEGKTEPRLTVT